jgi:hypothetical protein
LISNCWVEDPVDEGITCVATGAEGLMICDNTVTDLSTITVAAIHANGDDVTVTNNQVAVGTGTPAGIRISAQDCIVTGNRITGATDGIRNLDGRNVICNNRIEGCSDEGIEMTSAVGHNSVCNNVITNCSGDGILDTTSDYNTFMGNVLWNITGTDINETGANNIRQTAAGDDYNSIL